MSEKNVQSIGWEEYAVFAATLSFSVGIGIYYGFFGSKQKSTKEYLMANKSMSAFPVATSMVCSAISAITLLGNPVEIYLYGTQYMMVVLSFIPFSLSLSYLYLPVYFNLDVNSAYEFIEMRFSSRTRFIVSVIAVIHLIVSMAIAVYAPSLAINQVTGIDTKISTAAIYFVCIFYSSLGGLKAVLWTDVFQAFVMLASLLVIVIKGVSDVGGWDYVWRIADEGGRIDFFNFDPDTRTRHTMWTSVVAGYFFWIPTYASTQIQIQRFLSMPNLATARLSLIYNAIGLTVIVLLCCFAGMVIFANYHDCDPLLNDDITKYDQILPLFVTKSVKDLPGLMGVFIAGITCASMSTLSSGLSALTSITTYDYIRKLYPHFSDSKLAWLSKLNCFLLGLLSYSFVFVVENMGSILPATSAILGIFVGPILGLFTMGMFFPWANTKGCVFGMLVAFALMITFTVGNQLKADDLPNQFLPRSTDGCDIKSNGTFTTLPTTTPLLETTTYWKDKDDSVLVQILSISYLWYSALGFVISMVVGLASSAAVNVYEGIQPIKKEYISPPVCRLWIKVFPEKAKVWFLQDDSKGDQNIEVERL